MPTMREVLDRNGLPADALDKLEGGRECRTSDTAPDGFRHLSAGECMHTKVTEYCHNCGSDIPEGAKVSVDDLGPFINCPKCGGSQDIDTTRDRDGGERVN